MASVMRFDEWQDSNGVPVLDGAGGGLALGKILQVVSTTKTDTFSTTSLTYTAVTGLTAAITPTATSSKILVLCTMAVGSSTGGNGVHVRLSGGNSSAYIGGASGSRIQSVYSYLSSFVEGSMTEFTLSYLDSPATTSEVTYGVDIRQTGTGINCHVNRSQSDADNNTQGRGASTITVLEVAA